jgi:hypothetical protein
MHYEWHARDLPEARRWTEAALALAGSWSRAHEALAREELLHRLARLDRKLAAAA